MARRRKARELALQFLYQLDQSGDSEPGPHEAEFWTRHAVDDDARRFASEMVRGTKANQPRIDATITECTEHWDLDRMAVVDRNILRLAIYELMWGHDVRHAAKCMVLMIMYSHPFVCHNTPKLLSRKSACKHQ